jgi:uncharacterized membrane protein
MNTALKFILLLALIVWLGGIIFFSAVVAPTVFSLLSPIDGGRHLPGEIVSQSLGALHWIGLICGVVLVISFSTLKRFRVIRLFLVLAMLALTAFSQFGIMPKMAAMRASGTVSGTEFARLHQLSTITEGAVLLLGLGVVGLVSKRME